MLPVVCLRLTTRMQALPTSRLLAIGCRLRTVVIVVVVVCCMQRAKLPTNSSFGTRLQESFRTSRKYKSCGRVFKVFAAGGKQGK